VNDKGVFRVEEMVSLRSPDAKRNSVLKYGQDLLETASHQLWPLPHVELITCTFVASNMMAPALRNIGTMRGCTGHGDVCLLASMEVCIKQDPVGQHCFKHETNMHDLGMFLVTAEAGAGCAKHRIHVLQQ